jgi:protein TonB
MIAKKNPKSDLERYRSLMFLTGVAIVLGLVLGALEYKTEVAKLFPKQIEEASILDVAIPITVRPGPKKPKPKPKTKVDYTKKPVVEPQPTAPDNRIKPKLDPYAGKDIGQEPSSELLNIETVDMVFLERIARPAECQELREREEQLACLNTWISRYLAKNLEYPKIGLELRIEEKIYIEFVINEFGVVESVKALRASSEALASEAERVVNAMPAFIPASQQNRPVKMRMVVPVSFKLQ